jgi:peptide/nickel transport system substrate-binding protein
MAGTPVRPTLTATPAVPTARELVILLPGDIATLDPQRPDRGLSRLEEVSAPCTLFDTLLFRNEDQTVVRPLLATEWRAKERRWELRLRSGVTFHDGSTLTSADVKFSIERATRSAHRAGDGQMGTEALSPSELFEAVERVETPDPLTVALVTGRPDPLMPARLAAAGSQIVPKAYLERIGQEAFAQRPVGSGPYRLVSWTSGGDLVLERHPGYWGGPAAFERIVFRRQRDPAQGVAALLAGEAGLVTSVLPEHMEAIDRSGRARVEGVLFNGLHVLAANSRIPPLDRPGLKQALSLAIDREAILKAVYHGQGVVPNGLIAQGDFGFDATLPPLEYHPERARQRLQAAGYAGEPVVLETTRGYLPGDRELTDLVAQMWRKVGIAAQVEQITPEERAAKLRTKAFKGLFWAAPASTLLDPDGMMFRLLGPRGPYAFWQHDEWLRLGMDAQHSLDQERRLRNYRRMNEIGLEHLPWIPVVQPRQLYGIATTVEFRPYRNGYPNLRRENLRPQQ